MFTPYSLIGVSCVHAIHADHVLRIVIAYLAKIAKLPVDGLLRRKKIAYLEILTLTGTLGHKINLAVLQLTHRHFIPTLTKMQKHHIFKQFLYVAQQIYSHKTVAQTKIIEISRGLSWLISLLFSKNYCPAKDYNALLLVMNKPLCLIITTVS